MSNASVDVAQLIAREESNNLEFKQSFYDLSNNNGKGEFVKDVLALANCVSPETDSFLVCGVQDRKHGGKVPGIASPLNSDQLAQIVAEYSEPVPLVHVTNEKYRSKT